MVASEYSVDPVMSSGARMGPQSLFSKEARKLGLQSLAVGLGA
jgi:hypothetical protein